MYVDGAIPRWAWYAHRLRQLGFEIYCGAVILLCLAGIAALHWHLPIGRTLVGRVLPLALAALLFWPLDGDAPRRTLPR